MDWCQFFSPKMAFTQSSFRMVILWVSLWFSVCLNLVNAQRCLRFEINPGCPDPCTNTSVAHIVSIDPNNPIVYDYLWIFSPGYQPTIFLFKTDSKTKLSIDWPKFFDGKNFINFNGSIQNSFAIEMSELFLVNMTDKHTVYNIPLNYLSWKAAVSTSGDNCSITIQFSNDNPDIGKFNFKLSASSHRGRDEELPQLVFTESGNLFQFTAEDIVLKHHLDENDKLQLSANLTVVTQGQPVNSLIDNYHTIDDEYSPGVFRRNIYEIESKLKDNGTYSLPSSSFIGWKPIAYYNHSKELSKSLDVIDPEIENITLTNASIALKSYYAGKTYYANRLVNFRFGSKDDVDFEFNNSTAVEFKFSCSLDNSLQEKTFSKPMTIILICLGTVLGLSIILFIVSRVRQIFSRRNRDFFENEGVINGSF